MMLTVIMVFTAVIAVFACMMMLIGPVSGIVAMVMMLMFHGYCDFAVM